MTIDFPWNPLPLIHQREERSLVLLASKSKRDRPLEIDDRRSIRTVKCNRTALENRSDGHEIHRWKPVLTDTPNVCCFSRGLNALPPVEVAHVAANHTRLLLVLRWLLSSRSPASRPRSLYLSWRYRYSAGFFCPGTRSAGITIESDLFRAKLLPWLRSTPRWTGFD